MANPTIAERREGVLEALDASEKLCRPSSLIPIVDLRALLDYMDAQDRRIAALAKQQAQLLDAVEAMRNTLAAFMRSVQTQALVRTETNRHHADEAFDSFEHAMALAEQVRYFAATPEADHA